MEGTQPSTAGGDGAPTATTALGGRELSGPAVGAGAQGVVIQERAYTLTRLALTLVGCGGLLEWKQTATKLPRT